MGLKLGLIPVTISHILFCTPFCMLILISRMEGFDKSLEEASMDLGENSFWTFWRVTFHFTTRDNCIIAFSICYII